MADSAEEFSWTVTSRWRTACLQSSCTSHSSVKRHKRKSAGWLQKKKDWLPGIPQWWNSASRKPRALGRDGCGHQHTYNKVGNSFFFKKKKKAIGSTDRQKTRVKLERFTVWRSISYSLLHSRGSLYLSLSVLKTLILITCWVQLNPSCQWNCHLNSFSFFRTRNISRLQSTQVLPSNKNHMVDCFF